MHRRADLCHRPGLAIAIPFLLLLGTSACSTSERAAETQPPSIGLTLEHKTAERISGTYRAKSGLGLIFDSFRTETQASLLLRTLDGQEIANQTYDQTAAVEYGGHLMGRDMARLASLRDDSPEVLKAQKDWGAQSELVQQTVELIESIEKLPESSLLIDLSVALGHEGITGKDYPSSQPVHFMAVSWAKLLDIQVPKDKRPTVSSKSSCSLECDPCFDDCFGMCGNGCNCWSWVCGDCCGHNGCVHHDNACRSCDGWPWNWHHCHNCTVGTPFIFSITGACNAVSPCAFSCSNAAGEGQDKAKSSCQRETAPEVNDGASTHR